MTELIEKQEDTYIDDYPLLIKFLASLPEDLWEMFCPTTKAEIEATERNLLNWRYKEALRDKIMNIQKEYNLPLHPNESYRWTMTSARIALKKREKIKKIKGDNNIWPPNNEDYGK